MAGLENENININNSGITNNSEFWDRSMRAEAMLGPMIISFILVIAGIVAHLIERSAERMPDLRNNVSNSMRKMVDGLSRRKQRNNLGKQRRETKIVRRSQRDAGEKDLSKTSVDSAL